MRIVKITDTKLGSYGKYVEAWPNKLNRYMLYVRFQGSDKEYSMSKYSVEDVHDKNVTDEWIKKDKELLTAKKQTP